jgi:hypothetical protein
MSLLYESLDVSIKAQPVTENYLTSDLLLKRPKRPFIGNPTQHYALFKRRTGHERKVRPIKPVQYLLLKSDFPLIYTVIQPIFFLSLLGKTFNNILFLNLFAVVPSDGRRSQKILLTSVRILLKSKKYSTPFTKR